MGRRRDAALVLAVLAALLGLARRLGVSLPRRGLVLGALGSLALEALTQRWPRLVRAVWERPWVQAAAVVVTLGVGVLGTLLLGPVALAALIGGLATYLVYLLVVTAREARSG